MQVIAAVAEFWRDLLIERTQAGLQRALAEGKTLGRKSSLTEDQQAEILIKINKEGGDISALAKEYSTTRQTIMRFRDPQL